MTSFLKNHPRICEEKLRVTGGEVLKATHDDRKQLIGELSRVQQHVSKEVSRNFDQALCKEGSPFRGFV